MPHKSTSKPKFNNMGTIPHKKVAKTVTISPHEAQQA